MMVSCRRWRFRHRVVLLVCTDGVVRVRWRRLAVTVSPLCVAAAILGTFGLIVATGSLPAFVEIMRSQ
jgi:hypothetical protein